MQHRHLQKRHVHYAINEKRLQALEKIIDIQSRMLADALDIEELLDS